jgi:hypothetical protein
MKYFPSCPGPFSETTVCVSDEQRSLKPKSKKEKREKKWKKGEKEKRTII